MATSLVTIDTKSLEDAARKLAQLGGDRVGQLATTALNAVIDEGFLLARKRMNAGINVTDQYMLDKMSVKHASPSSLKASITAVGDLTGLSHYNPVARAKVSGEKGLGVNVTVSKGATKAVKSKRVFIAPGLKDTEGNPFVFRRLPGRTKRGKSRLQRVLGPAVYQLFAHQIPTLVPEAEEALANELLDKVEQEFLKGI